MEKTLKKISIEHKRRDVLSDHDKQITHVLIISSDFLQTLDKNWSTCACEKNQLYTFTVVQAKLFISTYLFAVGNYKYLVIFI